MSEPLPVGWTTVQIGDALETEHVPIRPEDDEVYDLVSIRRRHGGMFHRESRRGRDILTKAMQRVVPGNFVIARRQIVHGACAIATEPFDKSIMSMSYSSFKGTEICLARYFFRLAQQPELVKYFWDASHGVVVEKLNFQQVEWLRRSVSLPPLDEQRRIVEILDTIEEAIEATERVIAKLTLQFDGLTRLIEDENRAHHGDGEQLGSFALSRSGNTPARSVPGYFGGGIPWLKSGEVDSHAIDDTEETVSTLAIRDYGIKLLPAGTVVVAMYGATAGKVGWLSAPATTNQAVLGVTPDPTRSLPRWLFWHLRSTSHRLMAAIQGSGQPNLSKGIIDRVRVGLPSLGDQARQISLFDAANDVIEHNRDELAKLHALRTGLASDLLTGRVRTVAS